MNLLLDTHVLLWWLLADDRLKDRQRAFLSDENHTLFVSAVSAFEITTKSRSGKLPRGSDFEIERLRVNLDFEELPVSIVHAVLAGRLPGPHRDPFDRLLAAQSITEDMPLLTSDPAFSTFPVTVMW